MNFMLEHDSQSSTAVNDSLYFNVGMSNVFIIVAGDTPNYLTANSSSSAVSMETLISWILNVSTDKMSSEDALLPDRNAVESLLVGVT